MIEILQTDVMQGNMWIYVIVYGCTFGFNNFFMKLKALCSPNRDYLQNWLGRSLDWFWICNIIGLIITN